MLGCCMAVWAGAAPALMLTPASPLVVVAPPPPRRDVVNKHLAPLLYHAKDKGSDRQVYTFAKLFTQLTFPPDKDHPFETRNDMYRYLQAHKRACLREGVMSAFMGCADRTARARVA